jgi:hypothetical protein
VTAETLAVSLEVVSLAEVDTDAEPQPAGDGFVAVSLQAVGG